MEWFGLEETLKIIWFQPPCREQGQPGTSRHGKTKDTPWKKKQTSPHQQVAAPYSGACWTWGLPYEELWGMGHCHGGRSWPEQLWGTFSHGMMGISWDPVAGSKLICTSHTSNTLFEEIKTRLVLEYLLQAPAWWWSKWTATVCVKK